MKVAIYSLVLTLIIGLFGMMPTQVLGQVNTDETIKVQIEKNPEDANRPSFHWDEIPNAKTYQLYLQGELFYSGEVNHFPPSPEYRYEPIAFGYYQTYLVILLEDGSYVRGATVEFVIGMEPPEIITPEDTYQTYSNQVTITWTGDPEALGYRIFINRDQVYDGPDTTFTWSPEVSEDLFGQYQIRIQAYNRVQSVTNQDRVRFAILKLSTPGNLKPMDGWQGVIRTGDDIPILEWDPVPVGEQDKVTYEVFIINTEAGETEEGAKPYTITEASSFHPESLEIGSYKWWVQAKIDAQRSDSSAKRELKLLPPFGLYIGVKGAGNANFATNPSYAGKPGFGVGAYVEKRIVRKPKFHMLVGLDVLADVRRLYIEPDLFQTIFEDAQFGVAEVPFIYDTRALSIPILVKFHFLATRYFAVYPFLGPQLGFNLYKRFTSVDEHPVTHQVESQDVESDQFASFLFDVALGLGFSITFKDSTFIAQRKLQLFFEFKYIIGIVATYNNKNSESVSNVGTNPSFLGDPSRTHQVSGWIGLKIIDF
jgi:hypothetical protein